MTEERFVTDNRRFLKTFRGSGTGAEVSYNTCEDRFLLLRELSSEEWSALREEVEEIVFARRTNEQLLRFRKDRGVLYVFDWKKRGHPGEEGLTDFLYLRRPWVQAVAPEIAPNVSAHVTQRISVLSEEEQRLLWERIQPRSISERKQAFQATATTKPIGLRLDLLWRYSGKLAPFVNVLATLLCIPAVCLSGDNVEKDHRDLISGKEFKQHVHIILAALWRRGALLYSLGLRDFLIRLGKTEYGENTRPGLPSKILRDKTQFAPDIFRTITDSYEDVYLLERNSGSYIAWFLLSTSATDIGDMSPALLQESAARSLQGYSWWRVIKQAYERDPRYGPASFPKPPKSKVRDNVRSRSLAWVLQKRPDLQVWVSLYERMIQADYRTYKTNEYNIARFFFRWLMEPDRQPVTPETLSSKDVRREDGQDVAHTYRYFLDTRLSESGRSQGQPVRASTKSYAVRQLFRAMEFHQQENLKKIAENPGLAGQLRVDNPVSLQDSLWKPVPKRRTHRSALSEEVLDLARQVLLSNEDGLPTYSWMRSCPEFKLDWIEVDAVHKGKWPFEMELSPSRIAVWQPTRALALYVMLEIPLRTFQVRWLDSGAGDEFVWDFSYKCLNRNTRDIAEPGRAFGVFQPIADPFSIDSGSETLGFYVTTNKNQQWNPEDNKGFLIPWPSEVFYRTLELQRRWCDFVSGIVHTTAVKLSDDDLNVHERIRDLLPKFHILFRDIADVRGSVRPISRAKIDNAWASVCAETERRLAAKGIKISLAKHEQTKDKRRTRAVHDLHSLRVSGITNLYLKGVPVEVISRYLVGHSALAMTLHYEASDPIEIRRRLATWVGGVKSEDDTKDVAALLDLLDGERAVTLDTIGKLLGQDGIRRLLLTNNFGGDAAALLNARVDPSGTWSWYGDGICPGMRCSEGDESGGPVKGGPRSCGNCRFFLTGIAFIYGQAHRCNQIMYELRRLATERASWYAKKRTCAKAGELVQIVARIEELDASIEPKLSDWWGRYLLLQKTLRHQSDSSGKGELVPMRTDVKAAVEKTTHTHLLKEVCQSCDILQMDQDALAPVMELRAIINVLMSKHGVSPFLIGIPDAAGRKMTTLVAEGIQSLFRAHYDCDTASAYQKIEALVNEDLGECDPVISAGLRQLQRTFSVAESVKLNDGTSALLEDRRKMRVKLLP